jgi:hypothetical protein
MPIKTFIDGDTLPASDINNFLVNNGELRQILYFTSSGTFTKATYPWLNAIRVKVQGAGGGSGGCSTTGVGQVSMGGSGGGGAYAESFITDISSLGASETVTVGAGGSGGAAGNNSGSTGGASSFGSLVSANGGFGGNGNTAYSGISNITFAGAGASVGVGQLIIPGSSADASVALVAGFPFVGRNGAGFLGSSFATEGSFNLFTPLTGNRGSGSRAPVNGASRTAQAGAAGGNGIVIVELFA